ncbi:hypothetical protein EJ04DRAFT_517238 [Polyplosphaeria fusca]|uniref:NAD dependent epimerase/dehydratase n=1 Tax=Polyplosphaeria fusca TaxID=682080 RepID=A0A9P4UT51_9PLEO|nr:hypothetical protein EJ04DRAFT_517238 [Polyplosphaeria fusca]
MGQEASKPRPGTELRVIGAGLPRTGTASFSEALAILLDGPVYHGGTQIFNREPAHIKAWISCWEKTPIRNSKDHDHIMKNVEEIFDGYAATTDTPGAQFVPELLEKFPDAKVICTVRDPEAWVKSMDATANKSLLWFLWIILLPLPTVRHFPKYVDVLQRGRWSELYMPSGDPSTHSTAVYDRHIAWLKKVVPEDQLVFFDVRDGWGPLCQALNVKVPDVPFPRINDAKAMDEFANKQMMDGLKAWAKILGVATALGGVFYVSMSRLTA